MRISGRPFENVHTQWLREVTHWIEELPKEQLSFTPPPLPKIGIVKVTAKDVRFWLEFVCVGPYWDSYVSSRGTVVDDFGTTEWDGPPPDDDDYNYLAFHPGCLSFLCRRLNTSPEEVWRSVYPEGSTSVHPEVSNTVDSESSHPVNSEGSDSADSEDSDSSDPEYAEDDTRLLKDIEYYDVNAFHGGEPYQYCLVQTTPRRDGKEGEDVWLDPASLKPLRWILARPDIFPSVPLLTTSVAFHTSLPTSQASCMKIFNLSEVFDPIIDYILGQDIPQTQLAEELKSDNIFTPPSIMQSTKDIFSLLQVNRAFYTAILRDRQNIFLRLAWMHTWMLPATPRDWDNWPNGTFHNGNTFKVEVNQDWRAYLLKFLRKKRVNVKSRWRLHKMAMQFGRGGRPEVKDGKECRSRYPVGDLAFRADVKPREVWEFRLFGQYEQDEDDYENYW